MMQDLKFLALCGLVTYSLVMVNEPIFLKSLGSSPIAPSEVKQIAQQVELEGLSKVESDFWDSIKEIDGKSQATAQATEVPIKPEPQIPKKPETTIPTPSVTSPPIKQAEPAKRFLLLGDSIMSFLGVAFENDVKKSDYGLESIKVFYKISTGLNRIDFYDWYSRTRELIQQNNPDIMVVIFGGNDDQNILDANKKLYAELTPEWEKAYEERVERYAKLLDEYPVKKVYWIGHPISNVARYNKFFPIFNRIYQKVSAVHPKIEFVDYWNTFAVNGKFSPIAADSTGRKARVRYNDGLHPTEHGAKIMIEILKKRMIDEGVLKPKLKPATHLKK
ncbi:DUF459 domain-containing protein [Nostoc sp. FACHB-190]|uniref:DUF459 domain-containing protein n=1 Tax=Nostoc sp. FACHB-190 TaxID=2692838 RepID=UPI001686EDD6|nr:DUF459 domain-containing protein [Nostoc sp. FACHB-190]MBD2299109.1 DUF459 domain-containing protein [Nostoc sp. FACHB-190]